jgi:hypothetical protein
MRYDHTQPATLVRVAVIPLAVVSVAMFLRGAGALSILPLAFCCLVLLLFGSLTVSIDDERIRLAFGLGLVHKSFALDQIKSAERVRNPWYYFWGVRWYGRGWLYNVSGLDGVRIRLAGDREARIGTDEAEALEAAIRAALGRRTAT